MRHICCPSCLCMTGVSAAYWMRTILQSRRWHGTTRRPRAVIILIHTRTADIRYWIRIIHLVMRMTYYLRSGRGFCNGLYANVAGHTYTKIKYIALHSNSYDTSIAWCFRLLPLFGGSGTYTCFRKLQIPIKDNIVRKLACLRWEFTTVFS